MQMNSKPITDYKLLSKEDIHKVLAKYKGDNHKPVSDYIDNISQKIMAHGNKRLIIDCFCGVGESTYKLSEKYPDFLIIGFDKSLKRLQTQNSFKKQNPKNLLLFQADIFDFYLMLSDLVKDYDFKIEKQYILYPNPWPKKKNAKKRVYLNNVIPYLFALKSTIEVRSNWGRFLVEFSYSAEYFKYNHEFYQLRPKVPMTPFEKKYFLSGQSLNKLLLKPLKL